MDGRAPGSRILETPRVLALVPVHPKADGHCLVIPKAHAARMHEVPDETLQEIVITLKQLATALDLRSYNVLLNNGADSNEPGVRPRGPPVAHVHFHLIPRKRNDGVRITSPSSLSPSREQLDRMAVQIRARLDTGPQSTP